MKLDNSNGRYTIIIAGILVISVVLVSLAFASEGWNRSDFTFDIALQNRAYQLNSNGYNLKKDHEIPLGVGLLPIAEKCVKRHVDTENEGWVYLYANTIPDTVPLYLNDVSLWDVSFLSYGGYEFVDGYIDVYQHKFENDELGTKVGTIYMNPGPIGITYLGSELAGLGIDLTDLTIDDNAEYVVTYVTFTLTDGPLQFNSNYLPELIAPGTCTLIDGDDCGICWPKGPCQDDDDLDKEVTLKFYFNWEGCPKPDQDFQIILTYKCMFPESPIPD